MLLPVPTHQHTTLSEGIHWYILEQIISKTKTGQLCTDCGYSGWPNTLIYHVLLEPVNHVWHGYVRILSPIHPWDALHLIDDGVTAGAPGQTQQQHRHSASVPGQAASMTEVAARLPRIPLRTGGGERSNSQGAGVAASQSRDLCQPRPSQGSGTD